jgi:hypothetical protein
MNRSARSLFRRHCSGLDSRTPVGHPTMLTDPLSEPDNLSLPSRAPLNLIGCISQFASPELQLLNSFSLYRNLRTFSTSFGEVAQCLRVLHGSSPERSSRNASRLTPLIGENARSSYQQAFFRRVPHARPRASGCAGRGVAAPSRRFFKPGSANPLRRCRQADPGISGGAFDDDPARPQEPAFLGVSDDRQYGPVLERAARVQKLGLAQDRAPGAIAFRSTGSPRQRRPEYSQPTN